MGLGILYASIVSAVADKTGDDSADAVIKIGRLINEQGRDFCALSEKFKFLREDINFSITTANYKYSGSGYLPETFKKVINAYLIDGTTKVPLDEVGIDAMRDWHNPDDNTGMPTEFCVTRIESDYYEIAFNRKPDQTYTVYMEIEKQWVDVTAGSETIVTKPFYAAFVHFVSMARAVQQGDDALLAILERQWWNPIAPMQSILGRIRGLVNTRARKSVKPRGAPFSTDLNSKVPSDYGR